ncbi:transglycosylase SLT domain-containing protein, partial [Candidatus Ichthyocystis hellenicum]|uniref:transglycosylase SLT domain-containing protein n=2 Tax=Candidatus Ichthyocystis TaxID=2929841 RepID=UPI000A8A085A
MKTFFALFFCVVLYSISAIAKTPATVLSRNIILENQTEDKKIIYESDKYDEQEEDLDLLPFFTAGDMVNNEVKSISSIKDESKWETLDTIERDDDNAPIEVEYDHENKDEKILKEVSSADEMPVIDDNDLKVVLNDRHRKIAINNAQINHDPDDVWERIRQGFGMPNFESGLVRQEELWYVKHRDTTTAIFRRAKPFLHYIVDQIQKKSMPTEFSLLPVVESAYNPFALSPAHASGLWQFIPSTGKTYNLAQNWWIDKRRDIVASTQAALEYFTDLYHQFGDWQLSLAGYNWGEAAVQNAIRHNQIHNLPTDYEHLRMPKETRRYIPRLQALKNIINNPQAYGFELPHIVNKPYLVAIEITTTLDIPTAAKLAELPIEKFLYLNPAFKRLVIKSSEREKYILLLPY